MRPQGKDNYKQAVPNFTSTYCVSVQHKNILDSYLSIVKFLVQALSTRNCETSRRFVNSSMLLPGQGNYAPSTSAHEIFNLKPTSHFWKKLKVSRQTSTNWQQRARVLRVHKYSTQKYSLTGLKYSASEFGSTNSLLRNDHSQKTYPNQNTCYSQETRKT